MKNIINIAVVGLGQVGIYLLNELNTKKKDIVYDPFGGRGTTVIEAALNGRNIIQNDINPLSTILAAGRLAAPTIKEISNRLEFLRY